MSDAIWLSEHDVVETVDLVDAIDAIESALRTEASGRAQSMQKTHLAWGGGHTLHAIGAVDEVDGTVATKTWAHTEGGATPLVVLWDAHTGALRAVVEAFALGQLRTGAMTGVATRWLAPEAVAIAALIGTGKQAMAQLAAVSAVRAVERTIVFSPDPAHRRSFIDAARADGWPFTIDEATSVAEAVADAGVITTATRARQPFLERADVRSGALINAIGAITPERAELSPELVARCDLVVADSPDAASRLATEVGGFRATALSEIVAGNTPRPPHEATLFKAMGIGLADLAIARLVVERSIREGRGANIAQPQRARPRLRRT
jgi:alanine dehydrogenase